MNQIPKLPSIIRLFQLEREKDWFVIDGGDFISFAAKTKNHGLTYHFIEPGYYSLGYISKDNDYNSKEVYCTFKVFSFIQKLICCGLLPEGKYRVIKRR